MVELILEKIVLFAPYSNNRSVSTYDEFKNISLNEKSNHFLTSDLKVVF